MATLRLFGPAREAAGVSGAQIPGADVAEVLDTATRHFGETFAEILAGSRIWLNGESATRDSSVTEDDEVAVIPPVSGG